MYKRQKLTQVLYHRYKAGKKGILMLACELIDNNGKELLKCVNQYICLLYTSRCV